MSNGCFSDLFKSLPCKDTPGRVVRRAEDAVPVVLGVRANTVFSVTFAGFPFPSRLVRVKAVDTVPAFIEDGPVWKQPG